MAPKNGGSNWEQHWGEKVEQQGFFDLYKQGGIRKVRESGRDSVDGEFLGCPYGTWCGVHQGGLPELGLGGLDRLEVTLIGEFGHSPVLPIIRDQGIPGGSVEFFR